MVLSWRDAETERIVLDDISIDEPWALLERFSQLVRLSGSADEQEAVNYITGKLSSWGVPYLVHHPTCLICMPGPATLRTVGRRRAEFHSQDSSFSPSTNGEEVDSGTGLRAGQQASGINDLFGAGRDRLARAICAARS